MNLRYINYKIKNINTTSYHHSLNIILYSRLVRLSLSSSLNSFASEKHFFNLSSRKSCRFIVVDSSLLLPGKRDVPALNPLQVRRGQILRPIIFCHVILRKQRAASNGK